MKLEPISICHGGSVVRPGAFAAPITVIVDYTNGDAQVVTIPSDLSAMDFGIGMDSSNSESDRKMKNIRFV
jgi:hypothetical protein